MFEILSVACIGMKAYGSSTLVVVLFIMPCIKTGSILCVGGWHCDTLVEAIDPFILLIIRRTNVVIRFLFWTLQLE